ncbi:uncharacterized protein BDR25DRAFT_300813 [Lindgomyces ingoldianus]|uniref:Uncharacterized protein n=1 Tax=Lindgomyces ingoldianus TaxID=673940 RepID=A0ACB6RAX3_9PLEO|nr:uncharacterized protein BDR25DRAFT_300813 [Lindgomyces ingoldianus]KAF2475913.1 hypothetical protein BDR25DRAFT_300813 [Lindgomyces ingoldianus]
MSQTPEAVIFPPFPLPRELRNLIYTHLFTSAPYLPGSFFGLPFNLHYGYRCCPEPTYWRHKVKQRWLLTSKSLMAEALEEYKRGAEWVYWGPGMDKLLGDGKRSYNLSGLSITIPGTNPSPFPISAVTKMPPNMSEGPAETVVRVRRFSLYIGNLARWETPYRREGVDGREVLEIIAKTLRRGSEKSPNRLIEVNTIRLQGHSYLLNGGPDVDGRPTCSGQTKHMFRNLKKVLDSAGVRVRQWEFEILDGRTHISEVVFEVEFKGRTLASGDGEEEDFNLNLVVDERKWKEPTEHIKRVHTTYCEEQKRARKEGEKRRKEADAMREKKRAEERALVEAGRQRN